MFFKEIMWLCVHSALYMYVGHSMTNHLQFGKFASDRLLLILTFLRYDPLKNIATPPFPL